MNTRLSPFILALGVSLVATDAAAQSFSSFDPRSMAMGGAGVAIARPDTATFFNPALLSLTKEDDDFALQIPYVGAKVFDPDDFEDSLNTTQDAVDALDATIDAMNVSINANSFAQLATNTSALNSALSDLDQDLVHTELGLGIAGGVPSKKLGIGVYVGGQLTANGLFNYKDNQDLNNLTADASTISGCITSGTCGTTELSGLNYITINSGTINSPGTVTVNFDTNTDLNSTADIRGVLVTEAGISFSHDYHGLALGVTPKYVKVTTFDYQATVDDADTDDFDGDNYIEEYTDFNIDIGIAKALNDKVNIGLVVKNIIEQEYDTAQKALLSSTAYNARGGAIVLSPQARVGIAYHVSWVTLAADLDLTKNKAIGFEQDSQQLAVGAEFDVLGFLQLRLGYKSDFEDSDRSTASAGLGVAFLGAHIDVAASGNGDEMGGAVEFGISF